MGAHSQNSVLYGPFQKKFADPDKDPPKKDNDQVIPSRNKTSSVCFTKFSVGQFC